MNERIKVTILGSGTCVPSLKRSSCSVLMEAGSRLLLFDTGPGTMRRLLEAGYRVTDIDFVLVSHFHPDHTGELASFLFANKYPDPAARGKPLTLAGGPGFEEFHKKLSSAWPGWLDLGDMISVTELRGGQSGKIETDEFVLTCAPAAHQPESICFRLSAAGRDLSAVYTGDTDFSENVIELARDTDLLVCEAALPDEIKVAGHMTPSLAGRTAAEAGAKQLVLTHFYPECEHSDIEAQCRKTYQGPLCLATDLMTIELPGGQ